MTQEAQNETFISHLVELRDRLLRAVVSVLIVFVVLFLYPGAAFIYDTLAQPMLASLPQGSTMIATGVITPFMVPVKVTLLASFILSLPFAFSQTRAFISPGPHTHDIRLALRVMVSRTSCATT